MQLSKVFFSVYLDKANSYSKYITFCFLVLDQNHKAIKDIRKIF